MHYVQIMYGLCVDYVSISISYVRIMCGSCMDDVIVCMYGLWPMEHVWIMYGLCMYDV